MNKKLLADGLLWYIRLTKQKIDWSTDTISVITRVLVPSV